MIDYGRQKTDLAVKRAEWRLSRVYRQAAREVEEKTKDWQKAHEARDKRYRQMVKDGKMSKADYDAWMRGQVFQGKQWEARKEQIRQVLLNSDKVAMNVIKDGKVGVFSTNANYIGYRLEHDTGINTGFTLYDENTVARLIKGDPKILPMLPPEKAVLKDKAYTYYNKLISNSIAQGIIQGESVQQIALRIARDTGEKCYKSALRNARTAYTGAQNAGRIEGLHHAQALGIKVKKQWLAIPDDRTRDAHVEMDGQVQEVDDPFVSELGEIDYPGDPNAEPANVYNCRCTLIYAYPEIPEEMKARDAEDGVKDMSQEEWEDKKRENSQEQAIQEIPFTERLKELIHDGDYTIDEYRKAGSIVYSEIDRQLGLEFGQDLSQYNHLKTEETELAKWWKSESKRILSETKDKLGERKKALKEFDSSEKSIRLSEIRKKSGELNRKLNKEHANLMKKVLKELQEYGGFDKKEIMSNLVSNTTYSKGVQDIHAATEFFPKKWTEYRMQKGKLNAKQISGRAYFNDILNDIRTDGSIGTSIHEYAHSLEYAVPGLQKAADGFYKYRTSGETAERLKKYRPNEGYGNDEMVKKDKFINIYMGKDYGSDRDRFPTELLSQGYEELFGDMNIQYKRDQYNNDPEMRDWLIGLMVLVK